MIKYINNKKIYSIELFILIFTVSFYALIINGYRFGVGDQTAHLAYILKNLNSNYFALDPLFKNISFFGPFQYLYSIIAALINSTNFEIAIFYFTLVNLFILNLILFHIAIHFKLSNFYSIIFIIICNSIELYDLGGGGWIVSDHFKPSLVGRIFAYFAILLVLKNKFLFAYIVCLVGSFAHPTLNALCSVIVFIISLINNLKSDNLFKLDKSEVFKILKLGLIFLLNLILFYLFWNTKEIISENSSKYTDILIWRIGDSINIKNFSSISIIFFFFFTLIYFLLLNYLVRKNFISNTNKKIFFFVYISILLLLFFISLLINYTQISLFYEIYIFRLVFLLKIFFIILFLFTIQNISISNLNKITIIFTIFFTLAFSNISSRPDTLLYLLLLIIIIIKFNKIYFTTLLSIIILFFITLDFKNKNNKTNIFNEDKIPLVYYSLNKKFYIDLIILPINDKLNLLYNFFSSTNNVYSYRYYNDIYELSLFLRDNLDNNKIILAPPLNAHKIRLLSKKSIFLDFKVIPFEKNKLFEWWQRSNDLLSIEENKISLDDKDLINKKYMNLNDEKFEYLSKKYRITHAVIYLETNTKNKIIYSNSKYKIIEL